MQAQVLEQIQTIHADSRPLRPVETADPVPRDDEVLIRVQACGVCRTELDEIEGRTPPGRLPMVLGHQVREFLTLAADSAIKPQVRLFPFADANQALVELETQSVVGAKVLWME